MSKVNHGWLWMVVVLGFSFVVGAGCVTSPEEEKDEKKAKGADWHYQMAQGYFESSEVPLAIRELTLALEANDEHADAHHLLGFIYMGRRDYTKSLRHFTRALEIRPEFHSARNNRGTVLLAMERWRDAIGEFELLLEEPLYATPEIAHNNLGWAYYNMRKYPRAIEHYKMAIFLKPQFCLGHNNLGLVQVEMGANLEAFESFNKAVEYCPDNYAEPHFHLGKLLSDAGDARAMGHFQKCAEIQPNSNLGRRCREYVQALR
jgi:Tfp pilus assembly protein PilF